MRVHSEEIKKKVTKARKQGKTYRELVQMFGIAKSTLSYWFGETLGYPYDRSQQLGHLMRIRPLAHAAIQKRIQDKYNILQTKLAKEIKSSTNTPYDAVKMTAKYVYNNIQYSSGITVGYCYEETASSTLEVGKSDCVGMTRLNVALLRTMGIPARSVGGCLKSAERCSPIFAVAPGIQTKVTPMTEGDFKKRGFLHEWLEVWTPETGWLQVEATSGQIFSPEPECNQYIKYAYDSNQYDRCTITSQSFWNLCSVS